MESTLRITDLRLSFIWVETVPSLLRLPQLPGPLGELGRPDPYQARFDVLVHGGADPNGLELPWRPPKQHFFWIHYLQDLHPLSNAKKEIAWKKLVPFRRPGPDARLANPALAASTHLVLEHYFYPFGIALITTVYCRDSMKLNAAAEVSHRIRATERFNLHWPNGDETLDLSLSAMADACLTRLRQELLGPTVDAQASAVPPFSVVTIVRGEGVDPTNPIEPQGEIHRALEAVTGWSATYDTNALPSTLEGETLDDSNKLKPAGHVFYGRPRGRAIWFPSLFTKAADAGRLGCFHRNTVSMCLQVESLSAFAGRTVYRRQVEGKPLLGGESSCARNVASALSLLYFATHGMTYRSHSPRRHLEDNHRVKDLEALRAEFTMGSLFSGAAAATPEGAG